MDEKEKLFALPKMKQEGNDLFKEKKYSEAAKIYGQAIGIIEQLQLKYFLFFLLINSMNVL